MSTRIIADIGSNHMGDMGIARAMIRAAAEAGVDTVKFQSWQASRLRSDFPDYEATHDRHRRTELSDEQHRDLMRTCEEHDIGFLTTCFDLGRVEFLADLGLEEIKVASPDCASFALLDALMERFPRLIVSTGMATDEEVEAMALHVEGHDVVVLHCISEYPTPIERAHLARMQWLESLGHPVGLSDHSLGTEVGKIAIARGVPILEKHLTLSRDLPGKDQSMSTEPQEFAELVEWNGIIERAEGERKPGLTEEEIRLREIYIGKWGDNR